MYTVCTHTNAVGAATLTRSMQTDTHVQAGERCINVLHNSIITCVCVYTLFNRSQLLHTSQ